MSGITLYILDEKGACTHERRGDIDGVMYLAEKYQEKYTLTPPPDDTKQWRWIDGKWQ